MNDKGSSPDLSPDPNTADRLLSWKEILEKGLAAHTTGRLDEAERLYRLVLEKDPQEPNALTNLGTLFLQRGRMDEGVDMINSSLKIKPNQANALVNLGNALTSLKRFEEAADVCQRAVELQPHNHDAFNNLGNALRELKRMDEALEAYAQAAVLKPDFLAALNNRAHLLREMGRPEEALALLDHTVEVQGNAEAQNERGNLLVDLKRAEEALETYERAIALDPDYPLAWRNKAVALESLKRLDEALLAIEQAIALDPNRPESYFVAGNILGDLKRPAEALGYFERAIALEPNYPEAFNNLGNALLGLKRWDEALAVYEQAQILRSNLAPAFANRGFVLREMGRYEEALGAYEQAIALDSKLLDALNNHGVVLNELQRYDEALASFDRAIAVDPEFADARWNKSYVLIQTEQYAEGWELYEWRWQRKDLAAREKPSSQPQWLGEGDVSGKTFLIRAEQGLGDSLQMLRYAPLLAQMGARVVVAVQTPLGEIVSAIPGVSQVVVEGEQLPIHDYYCMMMSLPLAFKTTIDTIPADIPYLWTSLAARKAWASRFGPKTRPRVGLAWSGSRTHKNDHRRSMPLKTLLPLLDADVEFVSLQLEYREDDEALLDADGRIRHFDSEIKSFMDTAALIQQMDLVISVDTSIAHMAGALGKPLWILLANTPDYRWHLKRTDSPWYPTARLFRQPDHNDWPAVVAQMTKVIADFDQVMVDQSPPPEALTRGEDAQETARREASIALYNHNRAVEALRGRSKALAEEGDLEGALLISQQAAALRPDYAEVHNDLGSLLGRLYRLDEAVAAYERTVALNPDHVPALNELGRTLRTGSRSQEALAILERARDLKPDEAGIYGNLGNVLQDMGRFDEALAAFEQALALRPDFPAASWNKALLLLLLGDYVRGWQLFEWRWRQEALLAENMDLLPADWLAETDLTGKTVLLHSEQGLGDTLQFCRYVPMIKALGATVLLEVEKPLIGILSTLEGVDRLIEKGEPLPRFDYHCPLMSLPLAFKTEIATVPAEIPYLHADPKLAQVWAQRLGKKTRLRVGLVWSGGHRANQPELWALNDRRNIPLSRLSALNNPNVEFYSLQKGEPAESELPALEKAGWNGPPIVNYTADLEDFTDTAALIENLDLVIAVDTSTAHLAGALGRPVWILNRFDNCWRWLTEREDSPWYPTARLYRQPATGDWESVLARVAEDLANLAGGA